MKKIFLILAVLTLSTSAFAGGDGSKPQVSDKTKGQGSNGRTLAMPGDGGGPKSITKGADGNYIPQGASGNKQV